MLEHQYLLESIGSKLKLMNKTYFNEIKEIASPYLGTEMYINQDFTKDNSVGPSYSYFFNKIFNNKVVDNGPSLTDTSAASLASPVDTINDISKKVYIFKEGSQNYTEYTPSGGNSWKNLANDVANPDLIRSR